MAVFFLSISLSYFSLSLLLYPPLSPPPIEKEETSKRASSRPTHLEANKPAGKCFENTICTTLFKLRVLAINVTYSSLQFNLSRKRQILNLKLIMLKQSNQMQVNNREMG